MKLFSEGFTEQSIALQSTARQSNAAHRKEKNCTNTSRGAGWSSQELTQNTKDTQWLLKT